MQDEHLVGDDAGDEEVAPGLGVSEDVEVADVEQVESATGIADAGAQWILPCAPAGENPVARRVAGRGAGSSPLRARTRELAPAFKSPASAS